MEEIRGVPTWQEELASLVDAGLRYDGAPIDLTAATKRSGFVSADGSGSEPKETLKDQVTGFMKSWGEMLLELAKGCKDIVQQTVVTEDSFVVRKLRKPAAKVSKKLSFLNEFLPEDRDPIHAWPVIFFVFLLALAALSFSPEHDRPVTVIKKLRLHPTGATRVQLPDGRYIAYQELGVSAEKARYSLVTPHSFLSSRLAGIPGVKKSLLVEYGVRLVSYDLPGFGESDPHRGRNLSSAASDMINLAAAIGIDEKFWLLGYSTGSMHTWAAMKYFPGKIAGAAMVAPVINPYEPSMAKEEMVKTWEQWLTKRKFMYFLARRFPILLPFFYRRSFLSGKLDQLDEWMALSLGEKDKLLIKDPTFQEFYQRNVEESVRQGITKPFVEESVLQVSNWGFTLSEFRTQKKCTTNGVLSWLMSMYSEAECELIGFRKPIHIWQGMEDRVAPPSMSDYISRMIPEATVHKIPNEGHFSFFYFCDECHRQIFYALFGEPKGQLERVKETKDTLVETEAHMDTY
ncbi:hydrolase, alpha/beta fold family protein [Arabidopsis lyrata subsp. lyrata]|uniref:Hydrolase, alpha/beta fold family protein n=1 Tax=Arabidopsis lyrata subsp. lyrata TaxID=81972 RepID=D7M7Y1_ARALL|nr:hydrolase, alpha/beta fold family protein [Arabidopsis lyrata subsp. lyrata]